MQPLVERLGAELAACTNKPFALFGHSMGAIICFELARHLRETKGIEPVHLFVSGRQAPQIAEKDPPSYNLPMAEFIDTLRRLKGTPPEVLENAELIRIVTPLLRADFELVQTYLYEAGAPLTCPITAFGGIDDLEVTRDDLSGWQEQTAGRFTAITLPGDHFFINGYQPLLFQAIGRELRRFIA
jgi:medium-chain acyl-[acyl-carrier-protein] hydrolase